MPSGKRGGRGRARASKSPGNGSPVGAGSSAIAELTKVFSDLLVSVGAAGIEPAYLDLKNTPTRVAKMYVDELLSSYKPGALEELKQKLTTFPVEKGQQEMIVLSPIPFVSLCGHHMMPFIGTAHVGYIPGERIIGLSKIPRIIEFFSRKLQIQERLTSEIADFINSFLRPVGLIVYIEARHMCMESRGVRKPGVVTRTSALRGVASNAHVKEEFYTLINKG